MHEYIVPLSIVINKHWKLVRGVDMHYKATKSHVGNMHKC